MLKKVRSTPNVTIYTISTGGLARVLADSYGRQGPESRLNYLQADNQMRTFSSLTGGKSYFSPLSGGAAGYLL